MKRVGWWSEGTRVPQRGRKCDAGFESRADSLCGVDDVYDAMCVHRKLQVALWAKLAWSRRPMQGA